MMPRQLPEACAGLVRQNRDGQILLAVQGFLENLGPSSARHLGHTESLVV